MPTVPIVPTKWIFSADFADQEDFVPTKRILRRPSGFCADQVDFVLTKWICPNQVDFVAAKWILC